MAEFWRALRTLKALQAEQAAAELPVPAAASARPQPCGVATRPAIGQGPQPNEPERRPEPPAERPFEYILPDPPAPGPLLHEAAALWTPNEPERARVLALAPVLPVKEGEREKVVR